MPRSNPALIMCSCGSRRRTRSERVRCQARFTGSAYRGCSSNGCAGCWPPVGKPGTKESPGPELEDPTQSCCSNSRTLSRIHSSWLLSVLCFTMNGAVLSEPVWGVGEWYRKYPGLDSTSTRPSMSSSRRSPNPRRRTGPTDWIAPGLAVSLDASTSSPTEEEMGNIAPSIHADRIPCGDGIPEGDIQETQSGQDVHLQCTCSVFAVMGVARRRQDRTMQTRKCLHGDGVPEGDRTG